MSSAKLRTAKILSIATGITLGGVMLVQWASPTDEELIAVALIIHTFYLPFRVLHLSTESATKIAENGFISKI